MFGIPILIPNLKFLPLPSIGGGGANTLDFILNSVIGLIDLNPLLDIFLTPLSWAMLFLL